MNLYLMTEGKKKTAGLVVDATRVQMLTSWITAIGLDCYVPAGFDNFVLIAQETHHVTELVERLSRHGQPAAEDHRDIGRFLGVPECCLEPAMIFPHEAMRRSRSYFEAVGTGPCDARALHFCAHLPCSPTCALSVAQGRQHSAAIGEIDGRLWSAVWAERHTTPLLLY